MDFHHGGSHVDPSGVGKNHCAPGWKPSLPHVSLPEAACHWAVLHQLQHLRLQASSNCQWQHFSIKVLNSFTSAFHRSTTPSFVTRTCKMRQWEQPATTLRKLCWMPRLRRAFLLVCCHGRSFPRSEQPTSPLSSISLPTGALAASTFLWAGLWRLGGQRICCITFFCSGMNRRPSQLPNLLSSLQQLKLILVLASCISSESWTDDILRSTQPCKQFGILPRWPSRIGVGINDGLKTATYHLHAHEGRNVELIIGASMKQAVNKNLHLMVGSVSLLHMFAPQPNLEPQPRISTMSLCMLDDVQGSGWSFQMAFLPDLVYSSLCKRLATACTSPHAHRSQPTMSSLHCHPHRSRPFFGAALSPRGGS